MRKQHAGILKGGSGKIAGIIQSSWKGINYIRTKPEHIRNPQTIEQQIQRGKFKAVTALAKIILDPIIRPIWNPLSKNNMGFNKFTQVNIHSFNEEGKISNYKEVKFSLGKLNLPEKIEIKKDPIRDRAIEIKWSYAPNELNSFGNDILNIITIEETSNTYKIKILNNLNTKRKEGKATIYLPLSRNSTIHIYPYFSNHSGTSYSHNSYAKIDSIQ